MLLKTKDMSFDHKNFRIKTGKYHLMVVNSPSLNKTSKRSYGKNKTFSCIQSNTKFDLDPLTQIFALPHFQASKKPADLAKIGH
jgi:hypothetical protein